MQSVQLAKQHIEQGKIAPIYYVIGTDQYLSQSFKDSLIQQVLPLEEDQFNFIAFSLSENTLSQALTEAISMPFFGDKKIVWIEDPLFLTSDKKMSLTDEESKELFAYLDHPVDSTVLVFYLAKEKADERKKVVKQLKKNATIISAQPLDEKEMRAYIQHYIAETTSRFNPEAFELFLQLTDMDLGKVIGELDKLLLFSGSNSTITKKMVEDLVPKSLEHNIFDMVNYVIKNKTEKAIVLYRDLLLQGEETIKINAILISHFRLLVQTKIFAVRSYPQKAIAEALSIHPYRVKLAMEQVRQAELANLGNLFDELVENDYRLKTGDLEPKLLFELFLLKHKEL